MPDRLKRVMGLWSAVLLGLGAMLGTGIYVSTGLAVEAAASLAIPALLIAALLALFNGLSSARLAAHHPVSGGTYEYGYRFLGHWPGFLAGWLFITAKSASAAAAALSFAAYFATLAGLPEVSSIPLGTALIVVITLVVLAGMRQSLVMNAVMVGVSLVALCALLYVALPAAVFTSVPDATTGSLPSLLEAAAILFVAFTGYGRIATLGEEARSPAVVIPRAIVVTVTLVFLLHLLVLLAVIGAMDAERAGQSARDGRLLAELAGAFGYDSVALLVSVGALFALAGVLLNLLLGISRVLLAMSRRNDLPRRFAVIAANGSSAPAATLLAGAIVLVIVLQGNIFLAWSFSAFTVLLYYAITNLAALVVANTVRQKAVSLAGLAGCLSLSWFVDARALLAGAVLLAAGAAWHFIARRVADS